MVQMGRWVTMCSDIMPPLSGKMEILPEEGGVKIVRNVANYLPNKTAPYTGRR